MRIKTARDLKLNKETWENSPDGNMANVYTRGLKTIYMETIYRYSQERPTSVMTYRQFNAWRKQIQAVNQEKR